jgi:hypothetical protein
MRENKDIENFIYIGASSTQGHAPTLVVQWLTM